MSLPFIFGDYFTMFFINFVLGLGMLFGLYLYCCTPIAFFGLDIMAWCVVGFVFLQAAVYYGVKNARNTK
jgi:hypothetical protein